MPLRSVLASRNRTSRPRPPGIQTIFFGERLESSELPIKLVFPLDGSTIAICVRGEPGGYSRTAIVDRSDTARPENEESFAREIVRIGVPSALARTSAGLCSLSAWRKK